MKNKKGFTLAELLIVVAIIAVLVAIAIPVFTSQLEKSREAADAANIRALYAQIMVEAATNDQDVNVDGNKVVAIKQQTDGWDNTSIEESFNHIFNDVVGSPTTKGTAYVKYENHKAILVYSGDAPSPTSNIYDINQYNNMDTYTYPYWRSEGDILDSKNGATASTANFGKAVVSGAKMWVTDYLKDKMNDDSISVTISSSSAGKSDGNAIESMNALFLNNEPSSLPYDKIVTVNGNNGTYQYYYKKRGSGTKLTVELIATRQVTDEMKDSKGNIIYNLVTEGNTDGWVKYIK